MNLGIERLCVFGMPPVEFVTLAADLGCPNVGLGLTAMRSYNPHDYADWSLRDDPALRRELKAALRACGVTISLLEGFGISPGIDVREQAGDLDLLCELGGHRINVTSIDRDMGRTLEGFALFAEMAAERGIEVVTEVGVGPLRKLSAALAVMTQVARPNFRLLIDTMHYFRLGGSIEEISAIDPGLIGYVQLCDAPRVSAFASYMDEALHERLPPGSGELPLPQFLSLVPRDVVVSLEVPQRSLAQAGITPRARLASCLAAARTMLAG